MYLSASLKTKLFCETSSVLELGNIQKRSNAARLPNFWTCQRKKRNKSARLPHFLSWQHQKQNNSASLPSKMESWVQICLESKVLRMPRKSEARSYEVLHLSRNIILANLKIWCSKMHSLSGNQLPDLLTSLMNMSLVLPPPRKMHLRRSCSNVTIPFTCHAKRHLTVQKWSVPVSFLHSWLGHVLRGTQRALFRSMVCFVHFDFEMCFAPQWRALFRHLNFQQCSKPGVLCTFWLGNVLRATTACTFSTSQLPKVLRTWGAFSFFTCGVRLFISHLATWLRTRRFSEPTFRPSGATNHWKNTVNRDFPTCLHTWIFFLLNFSSLIFFLLLCSSLTLPISAFHLSILSEVWLPNFLRQYSGLLYYVILRLLFKIKILYCLVLD